MQQMRAMVTDLTEAIQARKLRWKQKSLQFLTFRFVPSADRWIQVQAVGEDGSKIITSHCNALIQH